MLTHEENELLCRVEGDAPMGQMMRRYWIPALLAEEVSEPDGDPVAFRVLGENLVAFRDTDGNVGVLEEQCPHRRASLAFGRNEEGGLRCLYHGWKMDVEGNVLEMASEPAESCFASKLKHKAYPAKEAAGFIWIYMGAAETIPEFELPPFCPTEDTKVSVGKIMIDCNWAQILEGAIDSAHSSSLHSTDMKPARVDSAKATESFWLRPSTDKAPKLQVQFTNYGFRYAALRRPIFNADTHTYVRLTTFVAPFTVLIPPNNMYNVANVNVPIDDTHTAFHFIAWGEGPSVPDQEVWRKFLGCQIGIDVDKRYRKVRTRENNYLQDRQLMKLGNFTGIPGIPNQDTVMWETMGPIADRTNDRLGASDIAIVQFRRQMVDAVQQFAKGEAPLGTTEPRLPLAKLRSFEGVVPKTQNWRTLGASDEEAALIEAAIVKETAPEPSY